MQKGSVIDKGTLMKLNEREALKDILQPQNSVAQERNLFQEQIPSTKLHCSDNKTIKSMEIPDEYRKFGAVFCKLYWDYLTAGVHIIALAGLLLVFLLSQGKSQRTVCISDTNENPILTFRSDLYLSGQIANRRDLGVRLQETRIRIAVPQVHLYPKRYQFYNQLFKGDSPNDCKGRAKNVTLVPVGISSSSLPCG